MADLVIDCFINAILVVIYISIIPLGAAMSVGVVLGVIQSATQVQEQSMSFVAKILAASSAMYFSHGYWLSELEACFLQSFESVSGL